MSVGLFMQSFNKIGRVVLLQNRFNFFGGHFEKKFNFRPPYWIEVIDVERWNAIPLPTLSQATCIPNLKEIKAKLRAWQCRLTFYKMAAMTSTKYANDLKLKSNHLHVCRTICGKFQKNRSSSLTTRQLTHTQTHTHTQIQTQHAPNIFPIRLQYLYSVF